jgi:hypothetical protein
MALTAEERRAAAAARRQKVLGRGDSRLAQVTGTLAKPNDIAGMFRYSNICYKDVYAFVG